MVYDNSKGPDVTLALSVIRDNSLESNQPVLAQVLSHEVLASCTEHTDHSILVFELEVFKVVVDVRGGSGKRLSGQ